MLPAYDFVIPDDEVIAVGDLRLRTIHNPGHTPGSTSFLLEGHPILFSGDTLFPGGPGNTALRRAATSTQIIESIDRRLFTLPADLLVLPGHGLDTTIGTGAPAPPGVGRPRLVTDTSCTDVMLRANDDCWCGSGKKYKRCHKRRAAAPGRRSARARGAARDRAARLRRRPARRSARPSRR